MMEARHERRGRSPGHGEIHHRDDDPTRDVKNTILERTTHERPCLAIDDGARHPGPLHHDAFE